MSEQSPEQAQSWEINSSDLRIKASKVVMLPMGKLNPHPDNRPLGKQNERIEQLKILIKDNGFDSSHPLVVRPFSQGYQIIEGEHRFRAAKALGYLELPCVIRDLDDTEALIQLVLGNVQTESKPLEIGLNALIVVQKEKRYSVAEYAQRLGIGESTVRRYLNAADAYQFIRMQVPEGAPLLDEVHKLEEIQRCPQSDWIWLHDLIMKQELSKNKVIEISQAIRDIKTDKAEVYGLFDFTKIRQEIARQTMSGNNSLSDTYRDLLKTIEQSLENLDETIELFEYNVLTDSIESESLSLKDWFVNNLKELKHLTKQSTLEAYKDALQLKRSASREEAERTAAYFRDKKNAKEREEAERLEREMRQVNLGEWWQLGNHYLYCGEGSSADFARHLPRDAAFALCEVSQVQGVKSEGSESQWQLDWLIQKAEVIAVLPPIEQINRLFQLSQMPYQWAMSANMSLKKSEAGLGAWLYVALFSQKTINPQVRDSWRIDASDLDGNKSYDLAKHLLLAFSRSQDKVIVPYVGVGAVYQVAEEETRFCYGAEQDPQICKQIIEQWEETSGEKARKVEKPQ